MGFNLYALCLCIFIGFTGNIDISVSVVFISVTTYNKTHWKPYFTPINYRIQILDIYSQKYGGNLNGMFVSHVNFSIWHVSKRDLSLRTVTLSKNVSTTNFVNLSQLQN